jgi:predicted N-acyltransferase
LEPITEVEFRKIARRVRRAAQLPRGIRVSWRLDPDLNESAWNAFCEQKSPTCYAIHIATNLSRYHVFDLAQHEAGHLRQFIYHPRETLDHGDGWAKEMAFIHRRLIDES